MRRKSLIYLKLSRGSQEILARFALTLSTYSIFIEHISGKQNIFADAYSRSRAIEDDDDQLPYMTEKEAQIILDLITLPKNFQLSQNEMMELMESTPLPSIIKKSYKNRTSKPKKSTLN